MHAQRFWAGLAGAAMALVTGPAAATVIAAAAPAPSTAAAQACADVLFIGARGSGQKGPGTPWWVPTDEDPLGLGGPVLAAEDLFEHHLFGKRTVEVVSVGYPATPVWSWDFYNSGPFFAGINEGGLAVDEIVNSHAKSCPDQRIVLAGYSQGAMAVHRILRAWERNPKARKGVIDRLDAAILIGDGDRVARDKTVNYGRFHRNWSGIGVLWHKSSKHSFTKLGPRVHEVCMRNDPVCDASGIKGVGDVLYVSQHFVYTTKQGIMQDAAQRVALAVLQVPRSGRAYIDAQVGVPFSQQLDADITGNTYQLRWKATKGSLPEGVTLSSSGLLSGTLSTIPTAETAVQVYGVKKGKKGKSGETPRVRTYLVWGSSVPSVPPPTPGSAAARISAGASYTCAVTAQGGVKCWGNNDHGQLGNGTTDDSFVPVDVVGLSSGVEAISSGGVHTCALTTQGGVKCWGNNVYGQLGNGTRLQSITPVDVVGLTSGVRAIVAGENHTCALTTQGGVKCWGAGESGQLGNGESASSSPVPVDVVGLTSGARMVAAGGQHTCAVTAQDAAKCWGSNYQGQLGDGTAETALVPVDVVGLGAGVQTVATGHFHTCALTTSGGVKCWGNMSGDLGDGTPSPHPPFDVAGLHSGVQAVTAGGGHTCAALTGSGGVQCWGQNLTGQLGDGTLKQSLIPVDVIGLHSGVQAVTAGGGHTCAALTGSGGVQCWGSNSSGQLGDGTRNDSAVPVNVVGLVL